MTIIDQQTPTLADLLEVLARRTEALKNAVERERQASSDTTACRNQLNETQKAIDAEVAKLKRNAEWNTEWHSQRTPRSAVTP